MVSSVSGYSFYAGALAALGSARTDVALASKRLQTGYRVADAMDDASTFSVAQGLRGEIESLSRILSVNIAAKETVGVARQGAEAISDVLVKLEGKFIQLRANFDDPYLSQMLQNDINGYIIQIDKIAMGASMNGIALLSQDDPIAPAVFVPDGGTQSVTTTAIPQSVVTLSGSVSGTAPATYNFAAPAYDPSASNPRIVVNGTSLIDPNGISVSFSGASVNYQINGAFSITVNDTGGSRAVAIGLTDNGLPANGFTISSVQYVVDLPPAVTTTTNVATGTWVQQNDLGSFQVIADTGGRQTAVRYTNMTSSALGFNAQIYSPLDNLRQSLADARARVEAAMLYYASKQREISGTIDFAHAQLDALTRGLGAIADADVGKDQAKLEAAKVREQLSLQGFSIANTMERSVLGYLRDVR